MKKVLITILSLVMVMSVGCSSNKESKLFIESVEKGKLAIAEKDFEKASSMFSLALDEKEDEEISKLKDQCDLMVEIDDLQSECDLIKEEKENNLDFLKKTAQKMIARCEKILAIETESKIVIDMATKYKADYESDIKEYQGLLKEKEEKEKEAQEAKKQEASKQTTQNNSSSSSTFTGNDAVRYAMRYYGDDGSSDTLYACNPDPIFNEYGKCYEVVLKSKAMIEQGGSGTLFWVTVTESGQVIEN